VEFQTRWLLKSKICKWEITADRTVTKYIKTWVGKYKVSSDDDVEVNSFDSEQEVAGKILNNTKLNIH
jgi:hypothetical protein